MSTIVKFANIPTLPVGKMVKELSDAYVNLINSGLHVKTMPSVMLWGPPGVGKSQAVKQIAKEIEERTGKKSYVTDVRLLLFNPIDLRGIPTSNEDKTAAVWLKPEIFQMDSSDDVVNILFLDEISAAPPSVQAAAYQIALDRVIGEHRLPDNCIVICAGNRVTDKSVAYKMPKALANRLLHIEIDVGFDSWKKWAVENGINPIVTGYLDFRHDALMVFDAVTDDLAFATPRTWEMVSNILNSVNGDIDRVFSLVSGIIGISQAAELRTWSEIYKELPSVEDIFAGKSVDVPKRPDCLYALISAMTAYAKQHKDDMGLISNSINYANQMPADFSVVLMKDYMSIEKDYVKKLLGIPQFAKWMQKKGGLLNGNF